MVGAGTTEEPKVLSHRYVASLKPRDDAYRIPDVSCPGLAIRVAPSGLKTFEHVYRVKGVGQKRPSGGKFPEISLQQARDRQNELRKAGRTGIDLPKVEKDAETARQTAAEVASRRLSVSALIDLYEQRELGRLRTGREIASRLRRGLASILERPADEIHRRDLRPLFDAVADEDFSREAEKRRQTIGAMFRWALARDDISSDPTFGIKAYDPGTPRERVLTDEELRILWNWLGESDLPSSHADALRVQILLGARCGEVAGMVSDEVDQKTWIWTLPAARSKNLKARRTPLVGMAREIIKRRLQDGPVFPSELARPLRSANVGMVLWLRRDKLPIAHFTTHDLRRTCATRMADLGLTLEIIAAVVGHEASAKRETRTLIRHYVFNDKTERKRAALEAWDAKVRRILSGETSTNVVAFRDAV